MGSYGHAVKRDRNHKDIVLACRKVGAHVIDVATVKNAFDILVGYRGQLVAIEIKDGLKPPSQRLLTSGEIKCKNALEAVDVPYYVINSVEEMVHLLNSL